MGEMTRTQRIRALVADLPAPWADSVIDLLMEAERELSDSRAEVARLRTELDGYQGRQVIFSPEHLITRVPLDHLADGTILRTQDTGREYVLRDRQWVGV